MTKVNLEKRIIAAALIIVQFLGTFMLNSFAASTVEPASSAQNWTYQQPLNYPISQNGDYSTVTRDYSLFDAVSGYRVSDYKRAVVWTQHMLGGNFYSVSLPGGRD